MYSPLKIQKTANLFKRRDGTGQIYIIQGTLEPGDVVRPDKIEMLQYGFSLYVTLRFKLDLEVLYLLACEVGMYPVSYAEMN